MVFERCRGRVSVYRGLNIGRRCVGCTKGEAMTKGDWIFTAVYWYFCAKAIVWFFDEYKSDEPRAGNKKT